LTVWASNKAVNRDLHLQFEFSHDSSVDKHPGWMCNFPRQKNFVWCRVQWRLYTSPALPQANEARHSIEGQTGAT
jgi:hypothetical protein